MFSRKAKAQAHRREGAVADVGDDASNLDDIVQGLTDDVNRLARIVADVQSRLDSSSGRVEQALGDSRSANHLATDVAKKLELSLIDLNELRRDVDAIGEPHE
jgi:hypothetical protein